MEQEYEYQVSDVESERERQKTKIYQILDLISSKYSNDGTKLKVYVDAEEKKYYITIFAASSLEFITYDKAVKLSESGQEFFEISPEILHILNVIFKDRIVYINLPSKKNVNKEVELDYKHNEHINMFADDYNKKDYQQYVEVLNNSQNFYNNRLR